MKKTLAILAAAVLLTGAIAPPAGASERGGMGGFLTGCFLGIRTAADFNEGKALHWRDWGRAVPLFNIVVGILNGIDGAEGVTRADLQQQFGSTYY